MEAPPPDESNAFARALGKSAAPPRPKLRFAIGVTLSLVLSACLTISIFLLGALVVRGVRHGDWVALGAAVAVVAMTVVMARGRARR